MELNWVNSWKRVRLSFVKGWYIVSSEPSNAAIIIIITSNSLLLWLHVCLILFYYNHFFSDNNLLFVVPVGVAIKLFILPVKWGLLPKHFLSVNNCFEDNSLTQHCCFYSMYEGNWRKWERNSKKRMSRGKREKKLLTS